jgi:hypothetical protein
VCTDYEHSDSLLATKGGANAAVVMYVYAFRRGDELVSCVFEDGKCSL